MLHAPKGQMISKDPLANPLLNQRVIFHLLGEDGLSIVWVCNCLLSCNGRKEVREKCGSQMEINCQSWSLRWTTVTLS